MEPTKGPVINATRTVLRIGIVRRHDQARRDQVFVPARQEAVGFGLPVEVLAASDFRREANHEHKAMKVKQDE